MWWIYYYYYYYYYYYIRQIIEDELKATVSHNHNRNKINAESEFQNKYYKQSDNFKIQSNTIINIII
jgi:hypothetical protein